MASSEMEYFLANAISLDYQAFLHTRGFSPAMLEKTEIERTCVRRKADLRACGRMVDLEWDSEFFGFPCSRLEGLFLSSSVTKDERRKLVEILIDLNSPLESFTACRIGITDLEMIRVLEKCGFRFADVMNVYTLNLTSGVYSQAQAETLNADREADREFIRCCLEDMHEGRFLTEDHIPRRKGLKYYYQRTLHHLNNGAVSTLLRQDGERAGFAIGVPDKEISSHIGRRYGYLWLIALKVEFKGCGLGRVLFDAFLNSFSMHCDELEIGTQVGNIQANRLYMSAGAEFACGLLTLHRFSGEVR